MKQQENNKFLDDYTASQELHLDQIVKAPKKDGVKYRDTTKAFMVYIYEPTNSTNSERKYMLKLPKFHSNI